MNRLSIIFASVICFAGASQGAIILVPSEQPTIQAGVDAAVAGDTVLVANGTYFGAGNHNIDFGGKNLILMSENGPKKTTIGIRGNASRLRRAFRFHSGEDSTSVISGFTVRRGYHLTGGALSIIGASPTISNCIFAGNKAIHTGGALQLSEAMPNIIDCVFDRNAAGGLPAWLLQA